jgi:hypothetical protein
MGASRAPEWPRPSRRARRGPAACHAYQPDGAKIRALDLPTLVVVGKRDQMTPQKAGRALAAEIPGATLLALDAGHSMYERGAARDGGRPPAVSPPRALGSAHPGRAGLYSIIRSARASNDCGMVSPKALAVCLLMTRTNFCVCPTGNSLGFAPFNILST